MLHEFNLYIDFSWENCCNNALKLAFLNELFSEKAELVVSFFHENHSAKMKGQLENMSQVETCSYLPSFGKKVVTGWKYFNKI